MTTTYKEGKSNIDKRGSHHNLTKGAFGNTNANASVQLDLKVIPRSKRKFVLK